MNKFVYVVAGLLATLSLQTQAQDFASQMQPEDLDAAERAVQPEPRAAGGGLECFDAVADLVLQPVGSTGDRAVRTLSCPAGSVATGGGATSGSNRDIYINATGPTSSPVNDPNTWFTSVQNFRAEQVNVRFYARCCRVPGL